uniref:uncharacterized protein LOC120328341 n=1 Tax=Styela clava TaxID=7725 RepID=UPI00193A1103|nr:uncharacterized protein LOC120328341 [Styela clava]
MRGYALLTLLFLASYATSLCPYKCRCSEKKGQRSFAVICGGMGFQSLPTTNISINVTFLSFPLNKIKNISNQMFTRYKNLQHLIMSHNEIETVDEYAFAGLQELIRLDLSGNRITVFPWSFMDSTPKLSMLYINNNFLSNFPSQKQVNKLSQLVSLRIHNNTFKCSCNVFAFSELLQNNEKRSVTIKKYITIQNVESLHCTTKLKWKTIKLLEIPIPTSQISSNHQSRYKCTSPTIEMFAITTSGGEEKSARKRRSPSSDGNMTSDELFFDEPSGLLTRMSKSWTNIQMNQNKTPPPEVWMVEKVKESVFSVVESMHLKIICDVTNKHMLTGVTDYLLKTTSTNKDTTNANIHKLKGWKNDNEFTISRAKKDIHDGMRILCVVENVANTVAKLARIKVVNDKDTDATISTHQLTTESYQKSAKNTMTEKYEVTEVPHQKTKIMSSGRGGTAITSTLVHEGFSKGSFYNSTCSDYMGDSDNVIMMTPYLIDHNLYKYRYHFNNGVNLTMEESTKRKKIVVTIKASTSTLETMFICSSGKNIPKKWTLIKKGIQIHEVEPFYYENGTICISSSHMRVEVCGVFPVRNKVIKSMKVMVIVGITILLLATIIMISCALHRIIMGKNIHHYKSAPIRHRQMPNNFSKTICENVDVDNYSILKENEECRSEHSAQCDNLLQSGSKDLEVDEST